MSESSSPRLILDCGETRLSAIIWRWSKDGRLEIMDVRSEKLEPDERTVEAWADAAGRTLRKLKSEHGQPRRAVLALPPFLLLIKTLTIPKVDPGNRRAAAAYKARQSLPYPLEEACWDYHPAGGDGVEETLLFAAANRSIITRLAEAARATGFIPERAEASPVLDANALRFAYPDLKGKVFFLRRGRLSISLLNQKQERFAARILLLNDGETAGKLPKRLAAEITRTFESEKKRFGDEPPEKVFLAGDAAGLPEWKTQLDAVLRAPAELYTPPPEIFSCEITSLLKDHSAAVNRAVGAAAAERLRPAARLDLMPEEFRARMDFARRKPWLAAAAVCLFLAAGLLAFREYRLQPALKAHLENLRGQTANRETSHRKTAQLQAEAKALKEQIAQWERLSRRRHAWVRLLAGMESRLAAEECVWLDRLEILHTPEHTEQRATTRLRIAGRMLDRNHPLEKAGPALREGVNRLLRNLSRSPFIAGIEGKRFDASQNGVLGFEFVLAVPSPDALQCPR